MEPRLLLVEDHAAFRGSLGFLPDLGPGRRVVTECGSVAGCRALGDLLETIDLAPPDPMPPDGDGAGLVAVLRGANPKAGVPVPTAGIGPGPPERVAQAGAGGVLDKTAALTGTVAEVGRLARA